MVKKVAKRLAWMGGGFLLLLLLAAGYSQTQLFRDQVRWFVLSQLDPVINGRVYLGTIGGNLVTGLTIDSVAIEVDAEPLLTASRIELEYDPFFLTRRIIQINRISLLRPEVGFRSSREGVWNIDRLIVASQEDTATSPFTWQIMVEKLELIDGTVQLTDSAVLAQADHRVIDRSFVEYHDISVNGVNVDLSAKIGPREKQAVIRNIRFRSARPDFELRQFSGTFTVSDSTAEVKNMALLTGRSAIELDAHMTDIDLLGGIELGDLRESPVHVSIVNSDVHLDELQQFIPPVAFLDGSVALDMEADGPFSELQIRKLHVAMGQTRLHASGGVYSLHRPDSLYLDLTFSESTLYTPDALALMPSFNLPDYESVGVSTFTLRFLGKPLDFRTGIDMTNAAGNIQADVRLRIGGEETLTYDATTRFSRLDLAPVLHMPSFSSSLNGSLSIRGKGVDFRNLDSRVEMAVDSSFAFGNTIPPSDLTVESHNAAVAVVGNIAIGSMRAAFTAGLGDLLGDRPSFRLSGTAESLDLAALLSDSTQRSNINVTLNAAGSGLDAATTSGTVQMAFRSSRYRDYQLDSSSVRLTVDQEDPLRKELRLESPIADFSLTGTYHLRYLLDLISFEAENLRLAINEKFSLLDSSLVGTSGARRLEAEKARLKSESVPLDAEFSLTIKDLEPVSVVAGERRFNGIGNLSGHVTGGFDTLSLRAELNAEEFFYGDVASGVYLRGARASLQAVNLLPVGDPLSELDLQFITEAEDLHLGRQKFDSISVSVDIRKGDADYSAYGLFAEDVRFALYGLTGVTNGVLTIAPKGLNIYLRGNRWVLQRGAQLDFGSEGVTVRKLVLRSGNQMASLDGAIDSSGAMTALAVLDSIDLRGISSLLESESSGDTSRSFSGTASLRLEVDGTTSDPVAKATLSAQDVAFRRLPFGSIHGVFDYREDMVNIQAVVADDLALADVAPKLTVSGTVPLVVGDKAGEESMDLLIMSQGIQINILDPLVPTFDDLSGILRCDLRLVGPPEDLKYSGDFSLENCRFLFEPNNTPYVFSGRFQPEGDRIRVLEATAENVRADQRPGKQGIVRFTGDFALRRFRPTDFNLRATGALLVVKPETRQSSLSVAGDLFVEIGPSGLHFTGTIEHSILSGDVMVRSSRLVFPPTAKEGSRQAGFSIPVVVVDDTSAVTDQRETFRALYFSEPEEDSVVDQGEAGRSFLDGLEYDLNVETTGPSSEIRLIFSALPAEELQATFQGKWKITGDGRQWIGDLNIDRAFYSFYKQFDATGKLRFTGDLMDPELDILATYEGNRSIPDPSDTSRTRVEKIKVSLKITGTRTKPEHIISMTIDDIDYYSYNGLKSSDVESDAIAFVLAGFFPLTSSETSTIADDLRTRVGASLVVGASSLLTSELSEFLRRETGFIHSVELGYGSETADIRLSGTAFKGFWRYRGTVLGDPLSNSQVSLLYSFGDIFESPSLRNFMFELERKAEASTAATFSQSVEVYSARLFYRFSF
jgi:hypothetical protein